MRKPLYQEARSACLEELQRAKEDGDFVSIVGMKRIALEAEHKINRDTAFKASNGWSNRLISSLDLKFKSHHGEIAKEDPVAAEDFIQSFSTFLQELSIPLDCIFNADESGIQFRPEIRRSLVMAEEDAPNSRGSEKEQMTFMPVTNATGI